MGNKNYSFQAYILFLVGINITFWDKISGMYTFTDKLINITEKFYT